MTTFLFNKTIFGPITSRRFGQSLGINLLPKAFKLCNSDCLYCECGWTSVPNKEAVMPSVEELSIELEEYLKDLISKGVHIDVITFAGNGEPTIHPGFPEIVDIVIDLRNKYYKNSQISVLSNGLLFSREEISTAIMKVDLPVLKLDAGTDETFQILNRPRVNFKLEDLVSSYKKFKGKLIIQTMFVKGEHNGLQIDNTNEREMLLWIELLKVINPTELMIYSLDRDTPEEKLTQIPKSKLEDIAKLVNAEGIKANVY